MNIGKLLPFIKACSKGSGSNNNGTGGVSSWNDLTDKPFGTEYSNEVPILSDTSVEIVDYAAFLENDIGLEIGKGYIITWNGVKYDCIAEEFKDADTAIGVCLLFGGENSEQYIGHNCIIVEIYPEMREAFGGFPVLIQILDDSISGTISIAQADIIHHKINSKYVESTTYLVTCLSINEVAKVIFCDRTTEEVLKALERGKIPMLKVINGDLVSFSVATEEKVVFSHFHLDGSNLRLYEYTLSPHIQYGDVITVNNDDLRLN